MRVRTLVLIVGILSASLLLTSCPSPGGDGTGDGGGTPPDPAASQLLVEEGIALMMDADWDGALSKFSEAVLKDPSNGTAIIGYSALNLADIIADPAVVNLARNKLGFADYPSTMNMVLNPSSWMVSLEEPYSGLMPEITGENGFDGKVAGSPKDGVIDPYERMLAFAGFFMTHNAGFTDVVNTVMNTLGVRLDAAVASIKAVPDSSTFTLTWDMIFETELDAQDAGWPFRDGEPMELTFGKAELLAIAASAEVVRGFTYLAQVYSLNLPLGEYWTAFNPANGTMVNPPSSSKPFATFLHLDANAATKLSSAKTSYTKAIDDLTTAIDAIKTNRAGHFLSTDPNDGVFPDLDAWNDFELGLDTARKFATEVDDSITSLTPAYLPIMFPDGFDPETDWPTGIVAGESIGINYGVFFGTPLNLFGTVIDLEANGEPAYQKFVSGDFSHVTSMSTNNFTGDATYYHLKIPDITLGGMIPLDNYLLNIPFDNPATQYTFNFNWNDSNLDGKWTWTDNNPADGDYDPGEGESISSWGWSSQVEGPLKFPLDAAYGSNPIGYYSTTGEVPASLLNTYLATGNQNDTYRNAMRAALEASSNSYVWSSQLFFLKNSSMYVPFAPAYIAWQSFASAGTSGTDPWGDPMTSEGSVWWYGATMLHDLLAP